MNKLKVTFFGKKNDVNRTGFEVFLPRLENRLLDPVATLEDYIDRTKCIRKDRAVFLSLNRPHTALSAASVAKLLEESIDLVGLKGQGFSAKSFRPTGATTAIDAGMDPKVVQKVGRWKCQEVFFDHYVHSRTPVEFPSSVFRQ